MNFNFKILSKIKILFKIKRILGHEKEFIDHLLLPNDQQVIIKFEKEGNNFIIDFNGPINTIYENQTFRVKFIPSEKYPFTPPNFYWMGNPPYHRFYRLDNRGVLDITTNIANTEYGIYHKYHHPSNTLIEYIERIKFSLTPAGEKIMDPQMASYPDFM